MHKFSLAKHWQLFLITCALPGLFNMMFFADTIRIPGAAFNIFDLFELLTNLCAGLILVWIRAIAIMLNPFMPNAVKMNTNTFKIFFYMPLIYLIIIFGCISIFQPAFLDISSPDESVTLIISLNLIAMLCVFYCMYFAAKTLKTVELQKEAVFREFAGEFLLIWFYPIGIWIIQPRINKLIKSKIITV